MTNIKYTTPQVSKLRENKYVKSCSKKYITFTDQFKLFCIEQDNLWVYYRDIFSMCSFPNYIIESDTPKTCLKRWRHIVRKSWEQWLIWSKKGRKKKEKRDTSKMNKDEYIEYLEAKIALTEELQRFFGKFP